MSPPSFVPRHSSPRSLGVTGITSTTNGSCNEVRPFPSALPLESAGPVLPLHRCLKCWIFFPIMVSHVILRPGRNCFFRPHPAWAAQLGGPVSAPRLVRRPFRPSKLVCQLSELFLRWENESDSLLFRLPWSPENFEGSQACTSPIRLQVRTTTVSSEDFDQDT